MRSLNNIIIITCLCIVLIITSCRTYKCYPSKGSRDYAYCDKGHCHEIKKPKYSLFR